MPPIAWFYCGGLCAAAGNVLCELKNGTLDINAEYARRAFPIRFSLMLMLMVCFWPATLLVLYTRASVESDEDELDDEELDEME